MSDRFRIVCELRDQGFSKVYKHRAERCVVLWGLEFFVPVKGARWRSDYETAVEDAERYLAARRQGRRQLVVRGKKLVPCDVIKVEPFMPVAPPRRGPPKPAPADPDGGFVTLDRAVGAVGVPLVPDTNGTPPPKK